MFRLPKNGLKECEPNTFNLAETSKNRLSKFNCDENLHKTILLLGRKEEKGFKIG